MKFNNVYIEEEIINSLNVINILNKISYKNKR